MKDPRLVSERNIHRFVCDLLRFNAGDGVVWLHIANERRTTPREGAYLKRMGVRAGVADFLIISSGWYEGASGYFEEPPSICWLELKTTKGKQSAAQKQFQKDVEIIGCEYALARSVDEAAAVLKQWGAIK